MNKKRKKKISNLLFRIKYFKSNLNRNNKRFKFMESGEFTKRKHKDIIKSSRFFFLDVTSND